jgi:hypothetical protein
MVFLKSVGFDVASHMSILTDDARNAIKKNFSPKNSGALSKIEKKTENIEKTKNTKIVN